MDRHAPQSSSQSPRLHIKHEHEFFPALLPVHMKPGRSRFKQNIQTIPAVTVLVADIVIVTAVSTVARSCAYSFRNGFSNSNGHSVSYSQRQKVVGAAATLAASTQLPDAEIQGNGGVGGGPLQQCIP